MVEIVDLVKVATDFKESRSRSFRTRVGVALETFDGKIYGGHNIETYFLDGSLHAERVALVRALADGYNGTDFRRIVVVFQDAGHDKAEIFPACLSCWQFLWDFTHPYLEIINADVSGNIRRQTKLKDIFALDHGSIYPSNNTRAVKPRSNSEPKLPLNSELLPFYEKDADFRKYCDEILKVK